MAHGGHGSLFHQLLTLWGAKDVVCGAAGVWSQIGEGGQPVLSGQLQELQRIFAPQDDVDFTTDSQAT